MSEELRPPRPLCVGCAHDLGYEAKKCPSCGTPAVGAMFSKRIQCPSPSVYKTPTLCCCCLALAEQIDKHEVLPTGGVIQIPWCDRCKNRRFGRGLLAWLGWLGGMGGAYAAGSLSPGMDPETVTAIGAAVFLLILLLSYAVRPKANLRGHVAKCNAFIPNWGPNHEMMFRNQKFAELFCDLNDTRVRRVN